MNCSYCNKEIVGRKRKYCDRKCQRKYQSDLDKLKRKNWKGVCKNCNKIITGKRRKYCTAECRYEWTIANAHTNWNNEIRNCVSCGTVFLPTKINQTYCSFRCQQKGIFIRKKNKEYFKPLRRRIKTTRRDKFNENFVERINKIKVFERANWHCQSCNCETPRLLMGSMEDNEPTIDHIIPISKNGEHSYKNVQCLCRRCNALKADKILIGGV